MHHEIDGRKSILTYADMIDISHVTNVSHRIIRYVGRTGQEVHISSNEYNPIFSNDPYILSNPMLSISCIPMVYHDVFTGMLYIENANKKISENDIFTMKSLIPAFITKQANIKYVKTRQIGKPSKHNPILTARETEIIELVAKGLSNSEICVNSNISLSTTKKHINSIMTKLEADNRIKAVIAAKDMGLI